jgi:hypothetical protein
LLYDGAFEELGAFDRAGGWYDRLPFEYPPLE